jgi:signal transduction histidine kinase
MLARRSTLLAAAFALLLVVIGGAALAIGRGASRTQLEVARLQNSHFEEENDLASIRANVFLIGIVTRDSLLDPDPAHAARYIDQFHGVRTATERSLSNLESIGRSNAEQDNAEQSNAGKAAIERLHSEVSAYWDRTTVVLNWTPAEKNIHRPEFFVQRVRLRDEILVLAAEAERLMTENFSRAQARITSANARFQSSLVWITALALLLGLGISGATVARMAALERQSAATEAELRRLSGQIRMAQEQERRYLSRELHDQAGQMLTGLRMELASISHAAGEAEFSAQVAHAKGIVEQTLRVIRNIAMLLRPSMLDDLGLTAALRGLVRDVERSSEMEIQVAIDPALDSLPDSHCTCVYRVVQEALTNAVRHSRGKQIDISLTAASGGGVAGKISDDGQGFDLSAKRKGLGLVGLEERVRELGGTVRIVSCCGQGAHGQDMRGHGTRIEFHLPSPDSAPEEDPQTFAGINDSYSHR